MQLTEDEIIHKYGKIVDIVTEILYYFMNMNILAFHVDIA